MNRLDKLICLLLLASFVKAQLDNPAEELLDATNIDPTEKQSGFDWSNSELLGGGSAVDTVEKKSFIISLLMIIVSEIGDKTFLIAAIMAMKHSRLVVFSAAFSSLLIMSVLSAFLGHVVPNLIPKEYTDVCAALLFLCFGLRMMYEAYHMEKGAENEEMNEVEEELKTVEDRERASKLEEMEVGGLEASSADTSNTSKGEQAKEGLMNLMQLVFSPVFVQTFVLTFLGEWGDRSQISTIALAAANNVYYVTAGVVIGHGMCTALAVIGGRMLASKISVRTVTFAGAILFLIFGVFYSVNAYNGLQE
ncbi:vacuole protein [Mucor ambiguus]|uniref:GDT1 family protein n=1 Tax=Mucor ambiguus TaxID=91626 RepID=A0A0C9M6R9_9FUNG|nr:vacuole protein [Mucor ambiguus]